VAKRWEWVSSPDKCSGIVGANDQSRKGVGSLGERQLSNTIHGRQRPWIASKSGKNLIDRSNARIAEDPETRRTQSG
jgi:hypothetical protein